MTPPFLKWAGGKRWLVNGKALPIPENYERYVEPFLGSGAVFFHLNPARSLLSDINEDLILLYCIMRDQPEELWRIMKRHQECHSRDYYYSVRATQPINDTQRAAQFLYLNRTCWNGLYRVNLKGEFNVPIGTKQTVVFKNDDFMAVSARLANSEIRCVDFEEVVEDCCPGDFLFVDPPYTVQHNLNNFLKYNEKIFSWEDQVRLRDVLLRASRRGVQMVITNADHECIRELYANFGQYVQLDRQSVLAGDSSRRGATTEAMFLTNIG